MLDRRTPVDPDLDSGSLPAAHALSQSLTAELALAKKLQSQSRIAISVAAGNFFGDANRALVTGYAVGSGGAIAVQRGSAQLPLPGVVDGVEPFSQNATFIDVGMRPDFLVSADINQDGHRDLDGRDAGRQPGDGSRGRRPGWYTASESTDTEATVTATDNFWGCNGAATGTGCDVAGTDASNNPLIVSPYAEVTASLNTTTPATGSSIILSGGITQDSSGNSLSGNEGAFARVADCPHPHPEWILPGNLRYLAQCLWLGVAE